MTRRETAAYLGRLRTEVDNPKFSDSQARKITRLALDLAINRLNQPRKSGPVRVGRVLPMIALPESPR